ncbi:hypothetical protein CC86DRAFT_388241 [Ophiobolus disseminans]|uniref:Uncharacterized protein n=1 Tax=Ophiobolus disseminans TaxID=1469910 RepID=A0A6A6ZFH2_9PLEO|nr:hypothetical protein CC86DRAFT_388241 [Ophiobolus disseminans]
MVAITFPARPERRFRPKLKWTDGLIQLVRLAALAFVTTGIAWGAIGFSVTLKGFVMWGHDVEVDTQLALLGLVNKMLDVALVSSLEYTASFLLTTWMISEGGKEALGATFGDFDLKNELTKPWITIWSFVARAITPQWRDHSTIHYPKAHLQEVSWMMHHKAGRDNVGEQGALEWAAALSASRSLDGLSDLVPVCSLKEKGWQLTHARDLGDTKRWTGLKTTFKVNEPVESLSILGKQVWEVFGWMRASGHKSAKASTGWTGNLTLMVPVLNTICKSYTAERENTARLATATFHGEEVSEPPRFTVDLGSRKGSPERIECTVTFRQALHSFGLWIVDMADVDISQNHYNQLFDEKLIYQRPAIQDYNITRALAAQTESVLTRMDRLMMDEEISHYLFHIAHKLQEVDSAIKSDAEGLAVVLATIVQNLLSYSDQTRTALPSELPKDSNDIITSYPMQWQLYASGPRLKWQWASVTILIVVICCLISGLFQLIWHRMAPGDWTEVPGMMGLAQASPKLTDIEVEEKANKRLYYVDEESKDKIMLWSKASDRAR